MLFTPETWMHPGTGIHVSYIYSGTCLPATCIPAFYWKTKIMFFFLKLDLKNSNGARQTSYLSLQTPGT